MPRYHGELTNILLTAIGEAAGFFSWPVEHTEAWRWKQIRREKKQVYDRVWGMKRRGLIKIAGRGKRKHLILTKKGILELLLAKANIVQPKKWDGKWRMVLFDIPEDSRGERDKLRGLLKAHGFKKLQGSVFISPYQLNRSAIAYLKETGLQKYIRIIRTDEIDDDTDLRRRFNIT